MSFDWQRSYEVGKDGLGIGPEDGLIILAGGSIPPVGNQAPIGSFYYQTNGLVWKKFGATELEWRVFPQSTEVPFEDEGFPGVTNVYQGIKFAKQNAEGFPRAGIPLIMNGTVSNGDFITYSNLTPNAKVVFPVAIKLEELTWDNTKNNAVFDMEFYKNTEPNPYATISVGIPNTGYGYFDGLNHSFASGDYLTIKYIDKGKNCSDLVVLLWVSRVQGVVV